MCLDLIGLFSISYLYNGYQNIYFFIIFYVKCVTKSYKDIANKSFKKVIKEKRERTSPLSPLKMRTVSKN